MVLARRQPATGKDVGQARTVWLLTGALALGVGIGYQLWLSGMAPPAQRLSPLLLGILFAAAEVFVVHVEFRNNAHTVSLVEIPLVLGLYFASPAVLILGHLVGAAVALGVYRRQPVVKLAYNLACFALEDVLAIGVFHALTTADPRLPASWAPALLAASAASVTGVLLVTLVIAVSGGRQTWLQRGQALAFALAASAMGACTGAALAVLGAEQPRSVWLLAAPVAALYVVNRLVVSQQHDRRSLGFLQRSNGLLQEDKDPGRALGQLLEQTRNLFQSDVAALIYSPPADPTTAGVMAVGPGDRAGALSFSPRELVWPEWVQLAGGHRGRLIAARRGDRARSVAGVTIHDGIVTPVRGGSRVIGYLMVANRLSSVSRFSGVDLLVMGALAQQVSLGVAQGRFELMDHELRVFERQLAFRASHDSLTGLVTFEAFSDQLEMRLRDPVTPDGHVVVLVIELSAPEGPPVAERMLLVASERLRHVVRETDLVGRLDEGRLAIVASARDNEELKLLRGRVALSLTRPIQVDAERAQLAPQIGIAEQGPDDSAEGLIDRATLWMTHA